VSRVNQYAAPFSYLPLWILDPRTLAVIDQQKMFDSQKLFDPSTPMGMPTADFMAARFTAVVGNSIGSAVDDTVLRGKVETEIREVRPDDRGH
jgi:hypothetical protein